MQSTIRNVRELASAERHFYEDAIGHPLEQDQCVVIRVLSLGGVPSPSTRSVAIQRASEIARAGQARAASLGITSEEADQAIEDAIAAVRHERRS